MAQVIFGNHAAVVVPRQDRDRILRFYRDVLGFVPTRTTGDKDDLQLGEGGTSFHLAIVYGDVDDASEFLRSGRSIYLELKTDDVESLRQKILEADVTVLDVPDPHLYFQAPGGQAFRLVGISEDLTPYERDIPGDDQRNASLVAAVRSGAEQSKE